MHEVKLSNDILKIEEIYEKAVSEKCGAVALFIGTTRDNFNELEVTRLIYESYDTMALALMKQICREIQNQWPVENIIIHHRLGEVAVGEASVAIAISSVHRKESLEAVHFAINRLKTIVPIFKKEEYKTGNAQWKQNDECFFTNKN